MKLNEARNLAITMMDTHITHNRSLWVFNFLESKYALGRCRHPSINRCGVIELNEKYVLKAPKDDVLNTILHEIAHAIVGTRHGHDRTWKLACIALGARPERCSDSSAMTEVRRETCNYLAVCPTCEKKYYISRLGRRAKAGHTYCPDCCTRFNTFDERSRLTYHKNVHKVA